MESLVNYDSDSTIDASFVDEAFMEMEMAHSDADVDGKSFQSTRT